MLHYDSLAGCCFSEDIISSYVNSNVPMSSHKAWELMDPHESQYNIYCDSISSKSAQKALLVIAVSPKYNRAFG